MEINDKETPKQHTGWIKLRHAVFTALFFIPALALLLLPVLGQKDASVKENRALARLPAPSVSSFMDGSFQDALEDALTDQLLGGEQVKGLALDGKNAVLSLQQSLLYAAAPGLKTNYVMIAQGYYHYAGDEHRIVEKPEEQDPERLKSFAAAFEGIPREQLSVYFIENSRTVDFDRPEMSGEVYRQVTAALDPAKADRFTVSDYGDYCENFYQTDHHWNARGASKGYRAVYRLLHGTDEGALSPVDTVSTQAVFQGSYARQTHILCADETFSFQTFELPPYTTYINGRRRAYGNLSAYEKQKYSTEPLANHYANCFGGDFAQIVYDFGTSGKGRLLMVASSYSNPINALIAAGYDQTYVVDLRYYEEWAGAPFDPAAYCRENGIDTVLLLGDVKLFFEDLPGEG